MSQFSQVDSAPDVGRRWLPISTAPIGRCRRYDIVATAALYAPSGVVLDVGCGVGGDLARLGSMGLRAVGLDASTSLLATTRKRLGREVPLMQGDAANLPLRASSVDGCRIERVLQHVVSPATVVEEIARVVRPGRFLTTFDTDYSTYSAHTDDQALAGLPAAVVRVRHPGVGGDLVRLITDACFAAHNVVTERSHAWSFERMPTDLRTRIREGSEQRAGTRRGAGREVDPRTGTPNCDGALSSNVGEGPRDGSAHIARTPNIRPRTAPPKTDRRVFGDDRGCRSGAACRGAASLSRQSGPSRGRRPKIWMPRPRGFVSAAPEEMVGDAARARDRLVVEAVEQVHRVSPRACRRGRARRARRRRASCR